MSKAVILDDDDGIRESLDLFLEEEGYKVITFSVGADALDYLSVQTTHHLVLTDYLMPTMSGTEFLQRAIEQCHLTQHRYIMLAARPRRLLPAEANAILTQLKIPYMEKPFDLNALLKLINDPRQ
jgi:DNA-binding NtrC family response regulator